MRGSKEEEGRVKTPQLSDGWEKLWNYGPQVPTGPSPTKDDPLGAPGEPDDMGATVSQL